MLQGTDEWRQARCGSIGASDIARLMRRTKTGYSADRANLMADKLRERLTGVPVEIPKTFAMTQGTEREPVARMTYAIIAGVEVEEVGLIPHPLIVGSHASPDGLVGERGLLEIKCPMPAAHLETLDGEAVPGDHMMQMAWQMACTGRDWCDYVSFSPDFPPRMQLWRRRVVRDHGLITELEREVKIFLRELTQKQERLMRRYAEAA